MYSMVFSLLSLLGVLGLFSSLIFLIFRFIEIVFKLASSVYTLSESVKDFNISAFYESISAFLLLISYAVFGTAVTHVSNMSTVKGIVILFLVTLLQWSPLLYYNILGRKLGLKFDKR